MATDALTRTARHEEAYAANRSYVLTVLGRRCGWLAPDEREAALHDAWAILLEKERSGALDVEGMRGPQVRAYLTQTALNRALDEGRRVGRSRNRPLDDGEEVAGDGATPEDLVDAGIEGARVREIVAELSARQQTIVKLRFFFDRTPDEIQRLLRITERVYRRDIERAMRVVSERYELVREGRFCDSRASLVRAYVAGIAGPNRARDARDHLSTCPACRRFAVELRDASGRCAALLPLPVLTAGGDHPLARLAEVLGGGRDGATQTGVQLKQQLSTLSLRVDPATAAATSGGLRPSVVAAAVASCLALSGGATYCAVVGVPALHHHRPHVVAHAPHRRPAPKAQPTPAPATPTITTAARTAPDAVRHRTTTLSAKARRAVATATSRKRVTQRRHDVAAASEFGPGGQGATAQRRAVSTATSQAAQAAARSGSKQAPTEFDP